MGFESENISKATLKWSTILLGLAQMSNRCARAHNIELCMQSLVSTRFHLCISVGKHFQLGKKRGIHSDDKDGPILPVHSMSGIS